MMSILLNTINRQLYEHIYSFILYFCVWFGKENVTLLFMGKLNIYKNIIVKFKPRGVSTKEREKRGESCKSSRVNYS